MRPKIAYVMSRFPHLSETFILREMTELERQGYRVALYPLIRQKQRVVHAEARPWLDRARPLPFLSLRVMVENGRRALRDPGRFLAAWGGAWLGNLPSPKFFIRAALLFPQAVYAARCMQQEGIDHIHAHYATHPALFAWIIHRLTGIPYSVTVHAHDIFVDQTLLGKKLGAAAFIVSISEYNRRFLARQVGDWVLAKTRVIHCGINPADYRPSLTPPEPGGRLEILNIGSLQPYKGQRYLIEACAHLRRSGLPFRLRIIGEGEERARLERQITEVGLEGCVELLGSLPQEQVAGLLPTAHVYAQPSVVAADGKMEGIPVALMEALACELPVIASDLSGIPELVRPGETGLLVPPGDTGALQAALLSVYKDPQTSACLGRRGRETVLQQFNLHVNVAQLVSLFTSKRVGLEHSAVGAQ